MTKPIYIGECGHRVSDRESKQCRQCWLTEKRQNFCLDCGLHLGKGSTQRCMDCFHSSLVRPRTCKDCGDEFPGKGKGQDWQRCRTCYDNHRRNSPKPPCSVEECPYLARAKGLCWNHYRVSRGREKVKGRGTLSKRAIGGLPCAICGYNTMRSNVHKVEPSLGYTNGNMIPLCSRCHNEHHAGLIALPDIRF